jgi:prepilin-type processing-associated H-X9-DG protein
LIEPYVKNAQLFVCPSDRTNDICYAYNGYYLVNPQWPTNPTHEANYLGDIERPAEMIVLGESMNNYFFLYLPSHKNNDNLDHRFTFSRHNEGANYSFADGHSKWLGKGQFPPDNSTVAKYYYAN